MQTLFEINCGVKSDVGRVRKNNEDYIICFIPTDAEELKKNGSLFIVADGVGGAAKGEVASHFAADTVIYEYYNNEELPPAERLAKAIEYASREIFNHSQANGNFTRMATTIVAALVLQNNLIVAHVGDSRLYLVREGKIKQITRDHSVVAEMVRNGLMTEEEARTSKAKNRISRSVGGEADVKVDVSDPIPLSLGDRILLCSDGLTRYLDGEELKAAVQNGDVEAVSKELIKYANSQGGVDNVSAILLEIVEKAKIHIKKPVHPKGPPEKLGWDDAQTEYEDLSSKKKKKIPIWVWIGGIAVILVFWIFSLFRNVNNEEMLLLVSTQEETQMPTSTKTEEELRAIRENYNATLQYQEVERKTRTATSSDSEGEIKTNKDFECVYLIEQDDHIGTILPIFGLTFSNDKEYDSYENCNPLEDSSVECNERSTIGDPVKGLPTGKYLIVFTVLDIDDENSYDQRKSLCINNNGKINYVDKLGGN